MLLAGHHNDSGASTAQCPSGMRLRVRLANGAEQLVDLPVGKTTIGSSPRCDVRIEQAGVRPVHLLIVRESNSLSVRSWASDSRLNGVAFQDASIKLGDCLTFASTEIVFEGQSRGDTPGSPSSCAFESKSPADSNLHTAGAHEASGGANECGEETERAGNPAARMGSSDASPLKESENGPQPYGHRPPMSEEYRQLAERVEGLECLLETALFDPEKLRQENHENSPSLQPPVFGEKNPNSVAASDRHASENAALEREIESLKNRLSAANGVIAAWEQRSEGLESERAQWAADRDEWRSHRAELQERLVESEIRLAEYIERVEKLEQELAHRRDLSEVEGRALKACNPLSSSGDWTASVRPNFDPPPEAAWPAALHQNESSHADSPSIPDSHQSSLPELAAPELSHAEFDWSTTGKEPTAEWPLAGKSNDPKSSVAPISESTTAPETNWSSWQSAAAQPRANEESLDHGTALSENAWKSSPSSEDKQPASRKSTFDGAILAPHESSVTAPGDHSWPASSNAASPEAEDDISPFAEFSIWNQGAKTQEPVADSEEASSTWSHGATRDAFGTSAHPLAEGVGIPSGPPLAPNSDQADNAAPKNQTPTSSFIERYAHMFADESPMDEPGQPPQPGPAHEDHLVRKPRALAGTGPIGQAPVPDEDEESIEQYMAKLMQRVRGEHRPPAVFQSPVAAGPISDGPSGESNDESLSAAATPQPSDTAATSSASDPKKEEFLTTSLGTVRRKSVAIEQPANLEAFRALANESARRAIGTHALRKHRRNAVTKAIVATLAGMTSIFVMLEAPGFLDLQFITACVSLLVAAYWAGQTYRTLVASFRAAAYDGPEELLENLIDPFRPALPIDVEKS
jgi:hypothetical protein